MMNEIGDRVLVQCYTSFGVDHYETVMSHEKKFDEYTGEPYVILVMESGYRFHAENSGALTPPTMYYIEVD